MDKKDLLYEINKDYSYPDVNDPEFQSKIYKKREFYFNKVPHRNILTNYEDIKKFRDDRCSGKFSLRSQQTLISNFINPNTPFKGLLIYHGLGTGKTCVGVSVAEKFKEQIIKYNTKIHILVPGKLLKETWKDAILDCTGETYLKDLRSNIGYIDVNEDIRIKKQSKQLIMNYYKIMSYKSFYKRVLGEKIVRKVVSNNEKIKKVYKKNLHGDIDRDISIDKIENLDNTLLIIDEAHGLIGNEWGNSVKKIIKNSKNLKILLLTATPMINFADEIIDLINFLRPLEDQIKKDLVFTSEKNYNMTFKPSGKDYLYKMLNGYVSHFRGNNPLTFPKEVNIGMIPDELLFTHVIKCPMEKFQLKIYNKVVNETVDSLDRNSQGVANFCFPYITNDELVGISGKKGLNSVINQIKSNNKKYLNLINETFMNNEIKDIEQIIKLSKEQDNISGLILNEKYLKHFSIKFYTALKNINNLVNEKAGTAFIYFNLVKVGIDLFTEILLINGYLEYKDDRNYNIKDNTRDAITGVEYKKFKGKTFYPSVFFTMKGQMENDELPEIKKNILDNVYSNPNNRDGRYIKLLLGSRVMNEGITLENVSEIHILDVYYNLGKLLQAIGRVVRECKHYKITNDNNKYPEVKIYRYVVSIPDKNKLSAEEEMYKKAELKYLLVKDVERMLKEVAIDCPINYHSNIFPEEIKNYDKCVSVKELLNIPKEDRKNHLICPIQCDLQKCDFKCFDKKLNLEYYDSTNDLYKKISKDNIDFTTFTTILSRGEIEKAKLKIKELFKFKYVRTLNEIVSKVKKIYKGEQNELFEPFFVYKALDELIPINENDFNNFQDTIYDKFNIPGYLIYRNNYYIFQPYEQNENVPIYYRSNYKIDIYNELSLYNYLKSNKIINLKDENIINNDTNDTNENNKLVKFDINKKKNKIYDFHSILEYYNNKNENIIVGIIDKPNIKNMIMTKIIPDIFKIRNRKEKNIDKKRGTGIPTLKGTVCNISKHKEDLVKICKILNINIEKILNLNKDNICNVIKKRLLFLEKYSSTEKKNKLTYVIIPFNHPVYKFPYNLEDRVEYIINNIKNKIPYEINSTVNKLKNGIFDNVRNESLVSFELIIKNDKLFDSYNDIFKKYDFKLIDDKWYLLIE